MSLVGARAPIEMTLLRLYDPSHSLLSLSCTYRLNADFSVEEIETLLSSRFIDEDFFKPTVSRFNQQEAALATGRVRVP